MSVPILIPLLNPNEPDAVLAAIHVTEGQRVAAGDLLFTLETTKSTADVTAEGEGHVVGLSRAQGQAVHAGETFAFLAESPDWTPPAPSQPQPTESATVPANLRITQPALALAQTHGLDLSALPVGPLITETMIRQRLEAEPTRAAHEAPFDPTAIVIYGGGGHGKALIDLIRALGMYRIVGIIDDGRPAGELVMGVPFLGGASALPNVYAQGVRLAVNAVGGISNLQVRVNVFRQLAEVGFACPALVHPRALVEPSATLSPGVQVFAQAYVGSESHLGYGVIINTGAIISHDCQLGDLVNISPGALLAGNVQIGEKTLVGMGVTINLNVQVGAGARIGNGATVKADVPAGGIVRAGKIFPE